MTWYDVVGFGIALVGLLSLISGARSFRRLMRRGQAWPFIAPLIVGAAICVGLPFSPVYSQGYYCGTVVGRLGDLASPSPSPGAADEQPVRDCRQRRTYGVLILAVAALGAGTSSCALARKRRFVEATALDKDKVGTPSLPAGHP